MTQPATLARPLACLVALVLAACYVPTPVAHATLRVSAEGAYQLSGQAVSIQGLPAAVAAAQLPGRPLVVQFEVVPAAYAQAVQAAVAAVTASHAPVAFAGRNAER